MASLVMIKRRLPLVSLPKLTVPERSARIAESLGFLASNKSATRGRPPVMSRVLEDSCGMRAMTSPTDTLAPSSRLTMAPAGSAYTAGMSVLAKVTSLPLALVSRGPGGGGGAAAAEVGDLALARHFRDHGVGMRIPVGHRLARRDDVAVVHRDVGAVGNLVALALAAELVDQTELARTG